MARHGNLYPLKIHEEICHLALDGLQIQTFLLDERSVEVDRLSIDTIDPSLVSVERHEISACEGCSAVGIKGLHRHVNVAQSLRVRAFDRSADHKNLVVTAPDAFIELLHEEA